MLGSAMQPNAAVMLSKRQELLLAYRLPAAVVISSLALSAVLLKVLSEPMPLRSDPDRWWLTSRQTGDARQRHHPQ